MKLKVTVKQNNLREDKVAIWLESEDRNPLNIWSLSKKELTPEVLKAIVTAVERGILVQQETTRRQLNEFINIETKVDYDH
jgi:hypothetical protein